MSEVTSEYRLNQVFGGVIVDIAEEGISKAQMLLNGIPGGVQQAIGSALARAASAGKTEAKRAVTQEYTISGGNFLSYTRNINHFVGSGNSMEVVFGFAGYPIPLLHFRTGIDSQGRPVAHVKQNSTPETLRHAFRQRVSGHYGIYERLGAARYPIRELYGPATPQMMYANESVMDAIEEKVVETYEKRIDHEITRILNGWGR